jgi:hypothetical protein
MAWVATSRNSSQLVGNGIHHLKYWVDNLRFRGFFWIGSANGAFRVMIDINFLKTIADHISEYLQE